MSNKKWSLEEITEVYNTPLFELMSNAAAVHRENNKLGEVQVATLMSIKTGACTEDCGYCSQSARNNADLEVEKLADVHTVLENAQQAKAGGSTRFCMGAAWREVKDNKDFDNVIEMVKGVSSMGLEVCCTLGMLTQEQAQKLKDAGLSAYNHNLDTSEDHYDKVITTRTYQDRLDTIENVSQANISVCSGGILGLGESHEDRVKMLHTLSNLSVIPESIPVNALVPVEGTQMENNELVPIWDMVRMISTARIVFPTSRVRLSAGRSEMSQVEQAMCFFAGANSIFSGAKLLTTPNGSVSFDKELFDILGLTSKKADIPVKNYDIEMA